MWSKSSILVIFPNGKRSTLMIARNLLSGVQKGQKVDKGHYPENASSLLEDIPGFPLNVILSKNRSGGGLALVSLVPSVLKVLYQPSIDITSGSSPHPCAVTTRFNRSMRYCPPTVTTPYVIFCVFVNGASDEVDCTKGRKEWRCHVRLSRRSREAINCSFNKRSVGRATYILRCACVRFCKSGSAIVIRKWRPYRRPRTCT